MHKRLKIILKVAFPLVSILAGYILFMEKHVYPHSNIYSIRAQETFRRSSGPILNDLDYVILGDSSALYSVAPLLLSGSSEGRTLLASSLFHSQQLIKKWDLKKIRKGLIISQSFIRDHYGLDIWSILVPNGIMTLDEIDHLLMGENTNWQTWAEIRWRFFLSRFHLDKYAAEAFIHRLRLTQQDYEDYRFLFQSSLEKNAGHFAENSDKVLPSTKFMAPYFNHFSNAVTIPSSELSTLKGIVQEAKKNDLKVFFLKTPMANYITRKDISSYIHSVDYLLNQIKDENFIVIDGLQMGKELDRSDFLDFNHLNARGAEKFSLFLKQQLTSY